LIRVHVQVAENWAPREIEARLHIEHPDGTTDTLTQRQMIDQSSIPNSLDSGFWWGLAQEVGNTEFGTKFQVELYETTAGAGEGMTEGDWASPADGTKLIGFQSQPAEMKVMMVPIHYTYNGADRLPDLSDENKAIFEGALYEQNPLQQLFVQYRDPVEYGNQMTNLGSLLPLMTSVRGQDGADPNIYYHAIYPGTSGGVNGVAGIAQLPGDNKSEGFMRVAATTFGPSVGQAANTFVHEVGHNQGLRHVACPGGGAAGPDPTYPDPEGLTTAWGFGIRSFTLHAPQEYDYMTYCGPSWASPFGWLKTWDRILTLTSWDYEGAAPNDDLPEQDLLIGAIYGDGTEEWFTARGGINPEKLDGSQHLELWAGEELVDDRDAAISWTSEGEFPWVIIPLEDDTELDQLDEIVRVTEEGRYSVDPDTVYTPQQIAPLK
jgi:hypothetical protein